MEYLIFKYLWVLAVIPKSFQLAVLGLLCGLFLFQYGKKLSFDPYSFLLFIVNVLYTASIVCSLFSGNHDRNRVMAALNTCLITYIAIIFYMVYRYKKMDIRKVSRYSFQNSVVLILLYLWYLAVGEAGNVTFLNPLCGVDWISGKRDIRFRGYLEYTNLVVFLYLYCYPFLFRYLKEQAGGLRLALFEIAFFIPILGTNSRTGFLLGGILLLTSLFLANWTSLSVCYKKYRAVFLLGAGLAAAVSGVLLYRQIASFLNDLLNARADSTNTRISLYVASIQKMLRESPVIGCGIKDLFLNYPYGSHSTYIGMFYKTGLLGGTLFLAATLTGMGKMIRKKVTASWEIVDKTAFLCLYLLCLLEDLDGANWSIVLFYSVYSVLYNQKQTTVG